ncbi:MAG: ABC transporter ATP-binding protein [Anaerolinea sp.]|nr:ABC transporter ATP-binding protein [Anaerolinea sp.]
MTVAETTTAPTTATTPDRDASGASRPAVPAIELAGLVKRFGEVEAVAGVDLAVPPGAFLVLLGPSGCGKTTILRMLAGLETPSAGEIRFGGRVVASGARGLVLPPGRRDAGLVFQSYALWPHMTVAANIEWPLKVARCPRDERRARVAEVLDLLGIGDLAARYPGEISGGQQQRVAIARTIGPRPSVLLFDEPLSNLDAKLRVEMRTELLRVHRVTGATSVYVTHDQVEAMTMASHVAVMRHGRVEQFGSPMDLLERPASPFVAGFVGTPPANLIEVEVRDGVLAWGSVVLGIAPPGASGQRLAMYRPERLTLHEGAGPHRLAAELTEATPLAGRFMVTCRLDGARINAVVDRLPLILPGAPIHIELPQEPDALFDVSPATDSRSAD